MICCTSLFILYSEQFSLLIFVNIMFFNHFFFCNNYSNTLPLFQVYIQYLSFICLIINFLLQLGQYKRFNNQIIVLIIDIFVYIPLLCNHFSSMLILYIWINISHNSLYHLCFTSYGVSTCFLKTSVRGNEFHFDLLHEQGT